MDELKRIELLKQGKSVVFNCRKGFDTIIKEYIHFCPETPQENDKWAYVGRKTFPKWTANTEFGNYSPERKNRLIACEQYQQSFLLNQDLKTLVLKKLKGKALGCWCYPEPCHAQILADFINSEL